MAYITTFDQYISYFKSLSEQAPYFKMFMSGGSERIVNEKIIEKLRSSGDMPAMFLEWPFIKLKDYGSNNMQISFNGAFCVLENPSKDDYAAQDLAMDNTLKAALQVISKIKADSSNPAADRFLNFDINIISIDPVENILMDQLYGWRVEFGVLSPVDIANSQYCLDTSFWPS
jgi:hypothetical protein